MSATLPRYSTVGWVLLLIAQTAIGDTLEWTNPVNGVFNDAANWTVTVGPGPPPPTAGDSVLLNEGGSYFIELQQDEAADFLRATTGVVSLLGNSPSVVALDLLTGTGDLSVRGGGTLNLGSQALPLIIRVGDRFEVAHGSGGGNGTLNLSGSDTELNVFGVTTHNIGISGNTGVVNVTNNASLNLVDGSTLGVGRSSLGASSGFVEVVNGGDLTAGHIDVATIDSTALGSLTVRGFGSTATQTGDSTLAIGNSSAVRTLFQVIDGAVFNTGTGDITLGESAVVNVGPVDQNTLFSFFEGGTMNANGPITMSLGSRIVVAEGTLNVNAGLDNSAGGQISLLSGGLLNIANGLFIANNPNLDTPFFVVGGESGGAATDLRIEGFGTADISTRLFIGESREGTVTVTGGGVLNNNLGGLGFSASTSVGRSNKGTLRIEAGGVVHSNGNALIGDTATGDGTVEVDGPGSVWNVAENLVVGNFGVGALRITDGGDVNVLTGSDVFIGGGGASTNADGTVEVDGVGSTLDVSDFLFLGAGGTGALDITDGGSVSAAAAWVYSGRIDVHGPGSQLDVTTLTMGTGTGNTGDMFITNGGVVVSTLSVLGFTAESDVSVSGLGSRFEAGALKVGDQQDGLLQVLFGGRIESTGTTIGDDAGVSGRIAVGNEGTLEVTGDLVVGAEGMGQLDLHGDPLAFGPTAVATVSGRVTVGDQGTIDLDAGRLEFGSMSLADFGKITGASGELVGDLDPISDSTDAASLPANLSNQAFNMSGVRLTNTSVLFGDRTLEVSLLNAAGGEVETVLGERLQFAAGTNAGEINNFGGQVRFAGAATNESTGFVAGRGQFIADGGWVNHGVFVFSGGPVEVLGDVTNSATGQIVVGGTSVATFFDDVTMDPAQPNIDVAPSGTAVFLGSYNGGNDGAGAVEVLGDLRPGNSPGVVTFGGDLSLGAESESFIELGGLFVGESDAVHVADDLTLSGSLIVSLLSGFTPALGDTFELFAAGSIQGVFENLVFPDAGYELVYMPTSVQLVVVSTLSGDYNNDGVVDAADYTVWRDNEGAAAGALLNDTAGGEIGQAQYDAWVANFGASAPSTTSTVPEPTAGVLVAAVLLASVSRKGRSA